MPLFQSTVVAKYLKSLDGSVVDNKWKLFTDHFHNSTIQENIRNSKEEQYQEGFLRDIFVKVLGYTLNPENNFNLTTEYKNIKDSKKADGAIILGEKVKAVIELKGTETTDLTKVESQAFGYKNNQPDCTYIITSNFEKLRFYIDNAIEHMEFNLFTLTKQQFELLYLSLAFENIEKDIPKKIKEESVSQEDAITKKLYNDYSLFKRELHHSLVVLNPQYDALTLFQKSQKLLDRFLFLFFAEDRQLLPPNSVRLILEQWIKLKDMDAYIPLFDRFKKYFGYLNTGFKGKQYDVYAYNGGLFKTDTVLDTIVIDDDLLYKHALKLSEYNFNSEVDVNILGHIFENSLNEIEEIQAQLEGQEIDRSKSKRKKDGVFYTPKYITKYIVENTIGKLCEEKKAELEIIEEEFTTDKKRQQKTRKVLLDKLTAYRNWLLQITICDPACGSGAFLNQALDFLIKEHRYIDELQAKLFGDAMVLSDVEKSILENNLFGVDINEESVEIAKLSLWLRTAQPNRKLNDLSNNIKCGNSLIDDPSVAGDKAFNWQQEFPTLFKEKVKKAFHITTATHDSRTSQRMVDFKVRALRDNGLRPKAEPIWLEPEHEILITQTIAEIIKKDELNVMAYNICGDHMHLVLVCEEEELTKIVGKIKAISSKEYNIAIGITTRRQSIETMEHAPLPKTREHAPLPYKQRGEKQNSLWTQKFGCKEIKDEKQLWNTVEYIKTNREKHKLPPLPGNKGTCPLVPIEKNKLFYSSYHHAFRTEYKGGFDVVIGNPPYVKLEQIKDVSELLSKLNYKTFDKRGDLYVLFVERGFEILKKEGAISYIMPNKWLQAGYGEKLREFLLTKQLDQLIDFGDIQIFEGATTYPVIFIARQNRAKETFKAALLKNSKAIDFDFNVEISSEIFKTKEFGKNTWVISSGKNQQLLNKLSSKNKTLKEYVKGEALRGILSGLSEAFIIDEETKKQIVLDTRSNKFIKPFLQGRDIKRFTLGNASNYMIIIEKGFTKSKLGDVTEGEAWKWFEKNYTGLTNWLLPFKEKAKVRTDKGDFWWELRACDYYDVFSKPKIMYQVFQVTPCFIYDENGLYCNNSMWILPTDNKALLGILNSKMGWWLITKYCTQIQNGCQLIWKYFGQIPIPEITGSIELPALVEAMITKTAELQIAASSFISLLQSKFEIEKLTTKLQNWHELEFGDFLKELEKARKQSATAATRGHVPLSKEKEEREYLPLAKEKEEIGHVPLSKKREEIGHVPLSLSEQAEWMQYFNEQKQKAKALKSEIDKTDKEIDRMVYELYNLTEEEIAIVEGSNR